MKIGKYREIDGRIIEMGLSEIPMPTFLFIGGADDNEGNQPWYMYDHIKKTKLPVEQRALTGYLSSLTVVPKVFKGKINYKLDIGVLGDKPLPYVIRSGINTTFTRGFILACSKIIDFSEIVTIIPESGDTGNTVFCKLLYTSEFKYVKSEWDDKAKLFPLIQQIQDRLFDCGVQEWNDIEEDAKRLLGK